MEIFKDLLRNDMLICAVVAYFIAQFFKILTTLYKEKKLDMQRLWGSGGMPSSHASTVAALTFRCAKVCGVASPAFAICFIFASVVMYDATGVRRAAGEQAKLLNQIVADLFSGKPEYTEKALKELIGHTPLQVVMGALLGIVIGLFFPSLGVLVS
ncbi:MAG: divergent PAP2 family protein [Clostridia bacterium]|nr:divergent PAP2 family protein [Clostridia bacterium]